MDPFETFDVTLFPHRVVVMPAFTGRGYVKIDVESDLQLLRHLLSSAEMDAAGASVLRSYALNWPAVQLEEVEADTHAIVVERVMAAIEAGSLIASVADLEELARPVRVQEVREVGKQDIVRRLAGSSAGISPIYTDKLLKALETLPEAVAKHVSRRAAKQLLPFFEQDETRQMVAGVFVVWAGKASPDTDYVVNGKLLGVGFTYAGWDVWKAFDLMFEFFALVKAARSDFEIQRANDCVAQAINLLTVEGFLAILRNVTPRKELTTGGMMGGDGPKKKSDLGGGGKAEGKPLEDSAKEKQQKPSSPRPAAQKPSDPGGKQGKDASKPDNKDKPLEEIPPKELDYKTLEKKVDELDVSSKPNTAVFYSGRGARKSAEEMAKKSGKTTLEQTKGGKVLDDLKLFEDTVDDVDGDKAAKLWSKISENYAKQASGEVTAVVNKPRPGSIFLTKELPALLNNKKVTKVKVQNAAGQSVEIPQGTKPEAAMKMLKGIL